MKSVVILRGSKNPVRISGNLSLRANEVSVAIPSLSFWGKFERGFCPFQYKGNSCFEVWKKSVLTVADSDARLTQHRPLTLPGFRAVYFNIKKLLLSVFARRAKARRSNLSFSCETATAIKNIASRRRKRKETASLMLVVAWGKSIA